MRWVFLWTAACRSSARIDHSWEANRAVANMPDKLPEAAVLAGAGVTVVFVALTILMLAIMLLSRLAPRDKPNKADTPPTVLQQQTLSTESVAAMAVAMALAMEEQKPTFSVGDDKVPVPQPVASPWAATGRERLMRSRAKPGRRWGKPSKR